MNTKLDIMGQRMATVEGQIGVLLIQKAAAHPKDESNAKSTAQILDLARRNGLKLDLKLITDA